MLGQLESSCEGCFQEISNTFSLGFVPRASTEGSLGDWWLLLNSEAGGQTAGCMTIDECWQCDDVVWCGAFWAAIFSQVVTGGLPVLG